MIKRYPAIKTFKSTMASQFPRVKILPYSQPPTATFFDDEDNIQEVVSLEEKTSLTELVDMFRVRGLEG